MALTFFVAELKCAYCNTVSKADTSTNMSNHLLSAPGVSVIRVGDKPDVKIGDFESAFLTLRLPTSNEPIRVLDWWTCPTCGKKNWAEIIFDHGEVKSIQAVKLSRASLDRANFVSEDIYEDFEDMVGKSMWENNKLRPNFKELLKEHLPFE